MQRSWFVPQLLLCASVLVGACENRTPTAIDDDLFPGGNRPLTLEIPSAAESLTVLGRFQGYTGPADADFLLVANRFGGVLDAFGVSRFIDFPGFVNVTVGGANQVDSTFAYLGGEVVVPVDTSASRIVDGPVTLQLRELVRTGADTVGSRLLSSLRVTSGDLAARDSVAFSLDSLAVRRLARDDSPGVVLTATGAPARITLGPLTLRTSVRPSLRADTTVAVTVTDAPSARTFVFSPAAPLPSSGLAAGGIASARTLFRLALPERVPGPGGTTIALDSVTINEAALLLDPQPVPAGFQPLDTVPLLIRRVLEPELGARAPLGDVVQDPVGFGPSGGALFQPVLYVPGASGTVVVPVTQHLRAVAARDSTARAREGLSTTLALLGEPEVATFGPAFFSMPRLRLVYTVPVRPGQR